MMRERIGVALALVEDGYEAVLDSPATGIFLLASVWLCVGLVVGVNL